MECLSYCLADRIDLQIAERNARSLECYRVMRQSQVIVIELKTTKALCFVFANGTLVTWNIKRYQMRPYLKLLQDSLTNSLHKPLKDAFTYKITGRTNLYPHDYFSVDCLELEEDDLELKLSMSYGFSQSIKLKSYEEKLERQIKRYMPMTRNLSRSGLLSIRHKKIQKIIGAILTSKAELNLVSDFLYQPKFFWQHPNLEESYLKMQRYMDIPERAKVLNEKLNTLNEIFLMFNGYLETRHESRLEIIIIILIAVEIIFNVLNLHF